VSIETIRQALLRLGVSWQQAKHWITSSDLDYLKKKTARYPHSPAQQNGWVVGYQDEV
jgi:hypothetical protein